MAIVEFKTKEERPQNIQINPVFEKLLEPLEKLEKTELEKDLLSHGCQDPIVVWNGYITDGHNRYEICTRNNIPFKTIHLNLEDQEDVEIWILHRQVAKRNVAPYRSTEIWMEIERRMERKYGNRYTKEEEERVFNTTDVEEKCKENPRITTNVVNQEEPVRKAAKASGVSHNTYSKCKYISKHADEETKNLLRQNKMKVDPVYRELKAKEVGENLKFPKGKFNIIHADPYIRDYEHPVGWKLRDSVQKLNHLPVRNAKSQASVLFFWAPPAYLKASIDTMYSWGFSLDSMFIWDHGEYYDSYITSETHSLILVGLEGISHCQTSARPLSILRDDGSGLSRHEQFIKVINSIFPEGRKLEMFTGEKREGWTHYQGAA